MASGWMRAAASALKLSHAAGTAAGNAAQAAVTSASNNRVSRGARHGIPGPWDAPPPPGMGTHGYWDYRGVARPSGIAPFSADFPLGRYREPRRWTAREEIGRAAVQSTNTGGSSLKSIKDRVYVRVR